MAFKLSISNWMKYIKNATILAVTGMLVIFVYIFYLAQDLPSLDQLENYDPDLVTRIYSADGEILDELYLEKRIFISIDKIPNNMKNALIASEDRRFYDHWGISMRDVFRAVVINLISFSYEQGFSSLTQQVARTLYDTIGFKKTIVRKIKEIITAIQIERTYTKNEIMEMYLNNVHFGHGTYGVQAAAKRYFGKSASALTLGESAMLVGILPAPARYSPVRHTERAHYKRNVVLRVMRDQRFITKDIYSEARAIEVEKVIEFQAKGTAPYFTEYIRRLMEKEDDHLGVNIYRDGLKIYTTLDTRLQDIAEASLMKSIKSNQDKLNKRLFNDDEEFSQLAYLGIYPEDTVKMMMRGDSILYEDLRNKLLVQGAFVVLDPTTGAILAMVGGRPDYHDQYNRAVQAKRQPGSVFKPFVYTTAIDNGYPVTKQLLNQPLVLRVLNSEGEWEKWMPRNYDGTTSGLTTLREGIRKSVNLVAVRVVKELVPATEVKATAERMGLRTNIRAVDAIALGTSEVYLLDVVNAYSAFANKGVLNQPFGISKIEDRYGNLIKEYFPIREEVLREESAYLMTSLLQTVMDAGTGGSARWRHNFYHPAGGKTGTTQNWTDAWFVGFSKQLAAGVWVGVDDPRVSLGEGQDGSRAALPAWARFMTAAHDTLGLKREKFERPDGVIHVEICSLTKDKPTNLCPLESEIFIKGTEPSQLCKVHRRN
ncbi:MAG: PBP1A family penicillin-binding protein [Candidatus Marinimicrobia bacterium]|jgi:penicillin-binding protein 1A|nr:PBP1A family penicillin-binding protein [Candidatus Neomarinimicrobiota bacterium]MBT3948025.1 PBP1A family penicillin-binding protein [Candidatus Neomarinimicrobiota bacterium]MBT4064909.1 PBP1A family penicillin-binding protein [Candidatus Neomarinimicrobiota bacterium]MBT4453034.1 PBP1A family penicillin-binding protein [Candidatus Neomarinimicrobiota bacterium]MBT4737241.1 PBP1A family penicillin-binding protein [Candidatus Neomarinimicrobiota bacterium]